jgi:hypothetical protein
MEIGRRGTLTLTKLSVGLPGITPAFGQTLAEAGAVCFEDQKHPNGVEIEINGTFDAKYQVFWQPVTDQIARCYNDEESTTELGAYGVAFLLILDLTDNTIIKRSRRGTGFDYWLGKIQDNEDLPFQNKERLEVSGIRRGDNSRIRARVNEKMKQVQLSSTTHLPALIVVVEFSAPLTQMVRNERN